MFLVLNKVLKFFWLAVAVFCLGLALYYTFTEGINSGKMYFVLVAVSLLMFWVKIFLLKRMYLLNGEQNPNPPKK